MLFRLLKKITKNYGIFLSLLFGIILALIVINGTIIYGNSLKDSLFQKVLINYETKNDITAGTVNITDSNMDLNDGFSDKVESYDKSVLGNLNLEVNSGRNIGIAEHSIYWDPAADINHKDFYNRNYQLLSMGNFSDHVNIIQGRIFNDSFVEGDKNIIEVVVDQKTMLEFKLEIDKLYRTELVDDINYAKILNTISIKVENEENLNYFKIVGVYKFKENDEFWRKGRWKNNDNTFVINENVMHQLDENENGSIVVSREYFIDFSKFKYSDRSSFLNELAKIEKEYKIHNSEFFLNIGNTLKKDDKNFNLVGNMLWIIQIPVFAILFLYILMITGIIVERDKDEIALLKSRGATKFNILSNYMFDGSVILGVGLLIGPPLSLILAKYMSLTSGFLEFEGELSKNLYFTKDNILFSILTGLFFLCALLMPVLKATKEGIVDRKQSKVRVKFSTWKKSFIDFILIGIGFYGFNLFKNSQEVVEGVDVDINYIKLDPLIFLSSTVFAFGLSLLFLRIYPYVISLIFKIFKKIMPPNIFVLFSNLGRKPGKREYVMLFIMVMICSSIFNLKIARTINTNVVDNIMYTEGSDINIEGSWLKDKGHNFKLSDDDVSDLTSGGSSTFDVLNITELIEPDFSQFEGLESLDTIAKVMTIKNTTITYKGKAVNSVDFMAVEPKAFGEVAVLRDDLTSIHWYHYLNVLSKEPNVVFLSSNIEVLKTYNLKVGDSFEVDVYGFKETLIFGGYIDYWPSFSDRSGFLMVGNFNYVYSRLARVPYEIWGSLKDGKTENDLLKEIEEKSINVVSVSSAGEYTKDDIFLKAVNASITISFILSMIVTLLGFMIYWVICIKERELQFGILRSLGLKINKIYTMIVLEQLLVTGVSLVVGIGIGQFISNKFLPAVTEIVFGNSLVLPIFDYISSGDYLLIVAIFVVSVILVLGIILRYISKIKISQAIKIGED